MGKLIKPLITSGIISGLCPRCRGPFTGRIDADEESVQLECSNCGHYGNYFYNWPDELPKVSLRHVSNGRLLGQKRPKKAKKKNPDNVLKGQLSFKQLESRNGK